MKTKAQQQAQARYAAKFVNARLRWEPAWHEAVKAHAAAMGESINAFVIRSCDEQMKRDKKG